MRSLAPITAVLASLALAAPAVAADPEQPVPPGGVLRVDDAAAVTREVAYSIARAGHYAAWRFVSCRRASIGRVSCRYALRKGRTLETYRVMVYALDTVPGDTSVHVLSEAPVLVRTSAARRA